MKVLIFTCLIALACSLACDSPLLNPNFNRLAPTVEGAVPAESIERTDTVDVCTPLKG